MSGRLWITRGLPASGKTRWAEEQVRSYPGRVMNVCRDDLRDMMFGGYIRDRERFVNKRRDEMIAAGLEAGLTVISSDTNLRSRVVRGLLQIARRYDAETFFMDFLVDVDTCIEREARRGKLGPRGSRIIQDMHDRFLRQGFPAIPQVRQELVDAPYTAEPGTPSAVLVDLDGTVALHTGLRDPYDHTKVHLDVPNRPVVEAVEAAYRAGNLVVFLSGRSESCYLPTLNWINRNIDVEVEGLYMRSSDDYRADWRVKLDLFDTYVRGGYDVRYVFDDRQQVVDMWRSIGLTVMQVAPGNF